MALHNEINRCRVIFKFAYDSDLIPAPVKYGANFKRPDKGTLRKHRHAVGRQNFLPEDIKRLLDESRGQLRVMLLLGVNAALGNADCCRLRIEQLDLAGGWINFPRPKTGVVRRAPLWPETEAALREIVGERSEGLVFQTRFLNAWTTTAITHELGKLLAKLGIVKRQRVFYGLRRSFRTIADECGDSGACDVVMGHASDSTMGGLYVQMVDDDRLRKVCEHVRKTIFAKAGKRGAR